MILTPWPLTPVSLNILPAILFAAVLGIVPGFRVAARAQDPFTSPPTNTAEVSGSVSLDPSHYWGELEYYYTFLEAPEWFLKQIPVPSENTVWHFSGMPAGEITRLLSGPSGMESSIVEALLDRNTWYQSEDEVKIYPLPEVIETMSQEFRERVYAALAQWPENPYHYQPVVIENGNVETWFQASGLTEAQVQTIAKLSYRRGGDLVFSDTPFLLRQVLSPTHELATLKALTRTRTLILLLKITSETDFVSLANYWTIGSKRKDILPLLESVARTQGVSRLDIVHLLPPTPRKYLYTYPDLSMGLTGKLPDGFWTAMNFFHSPTRDKFSSPAVVGDELRAHYTQVDPPYRFGDTMLLVNSETGKAVHACTYIADDIVLTKNGSTAFLPWVMMKISDMLTRFPDSENFQMQGWRRQES